MVDKTKSRNWCFTDFNLTNHQHYLGEIECKYIIVGKEICPDTKKEHLQGFIIFKSVATFRQARRRLPDKVHLELANGTPYQASNYCKKEGDFIEKGIPPRQQGARTDIDKTKTIIKESHRVRDVLDHVFNFQCVRTAEIYLKYKEPSRPIAPIKVVWLWGASGTGKTSYVYKKHDTEEVFQPTTHKWWEGYDGHKIVLIDDFRTDYCSFVDLLKLLDIYPFRVETKGGSRQVMFDTIYITSPHHPNSLYSNNGEELLQLERRVTEFIHVE